MKVRSILTLVLAVALGALAVLLARNWIERPAQTITAAAPKPAATKIVVARTDLFFGNRIGAEHLREVEWPVESIPEGAFTAVDELVDADEPRVVLRAMQANEPVLASKISGKGERATLSAVISDQMRAMTIRIDDVAGVAGFVMPGDRVDVLLTRTEPGAETPITDILLQNVKILGIDQEASEDKEKPKVARAATLEVTPEQSQKLTLASTVGSLSLALRNYLNSDPEMARTVSIKDLRVGEANQPEGAKVAESKPTAKVVRTTPKPDPLASVRIFRALNGSEYKVEKEGAAKGATAPTVPSPAEPTPSAAPTPLQPAQPEVSAGLLSEPAAPDTEI